MQSWSKQKPVREAQTMFIRTPDQVRLFIADFMTPYNFASVSATIGNTVSAWNVRLPKALKEQLINDLLRNGVNVACLRNRITNQLEGEYFVTFHTEDRDLSGEDGMKLLMQDIKDSKMFLDMQFS